jgi:hypothetical protein
MSPSDPKPARGEADLVAFGDPGVEIQIVDTKYQVLARGTDKVQKTRPEGVYMVDWTSHGQTVQKLVRLLPIGKPLEVRPDAHPGGGSSVVPALSPDGTNSALAELLRDQRRPSERDYGSEVLVVTRASDPRTKIDLSIGLRLINSADVAMRSDQADLATEQQQITDGYAARLYHVPAGNFRLRYIAMTGETLEQTVRSAFTNALDAVDADPFLKLYGALVVLNRLAQDASPALDDAWPTDPAEQIEFRARWRKRAADWLQAVSKRGAPPDVVAASWRLQAEGEKVMGRSGSLSSPPMLECAWRWAVAQNARDPKAVPTTASFRAAARTGGGTAPWLSWRPAAAKAQIPPVPTGQNDDLDPLIGKVADRVRGILEIPPPAPYATGSDPLSFLSQEARAMAFSVSQVTDSRSLERSGGGDVDPAKELAALFGAPAPQLKRRLLRTLSELDAFQPTTPTRPAGPPDPSANLDPPALRRMIIVSDDPNKGRFGRRRSRAGSNSAPSSGPRPTRTGSGSH